MLAAQHSKVVADTGEFELIREFRPLDSTTNPSLVLKAVKDPKYAHFLREALAEDTGSADPARCAAAWHCPADPARLTLPV